MECRKKLACCSHYYSLDTTEQRLQIAFLGTPRTGALVCGHWPITGLQSQFFQVYSPQTRSEQYCAQIDLGGLMLAAVPSDADKRLELFRLALLLSSRSNATLPPALAHYFNEVLAQARVLIVDPSQLSNSHRPQAIQLANEMRTNEPLRSFLEGVDAIGDMTRENARRALSTLEPQLASAD